MTEILKMGVAFIVVTFLLFAVLKLDKRIERIETRLSRTETQASLLNAAYQLDQKHGE